MKLKNAIHYLSSLIEANSALVIEIERSKKIWMLINFILRYPALVCIGIVGLLSSISIEKPIRPINIAILVFTGITGILNAAHSLLKPDVIVEISDSVCDSINGLNDEMRITIDELSAEYYQFRNDELSQEMMTRYLLIVVKFKLNKSNIMKNKPNTFFIRNKKIPEVLMDDKPGELSRKRSAFDFRSTSEDMTADPTPRDVVVEFDVE